MFWPHGTEVAEAGRGNSDRLSSSGRHPFATEPMPWISPIANRMPSLIRCVMHICPPTPDEIVINDLGAFAVGTKTTERDLLCLMILFHTHQLTFRRPILPGNPRALSLAALTQRSVAQIAAHIWSRKRKRKRSDSDERENYVYWYHLFSESGEFDAWLDVPQELGDTVLAFKARLLEHPDIASVEVEE